jgi:hypothetical protein
MLLGAGIDFWADDTRVDVIDSYQTAALRRRLSGCRRGGLHPQHRSPPSVTDVTRGTEDFTLGWVCGGGRAVDHGGHRSTA